MSVIAATQKLEEANLGHISWLKPELLQYNPVFLYLKPVEIQVFVSWISQQPDLVAFLEHQRITKLYSDSLNLEKHAQFPAFKGFITALLYPLLKEKALQIATQHDTLAILKLSNLLEDKEQDIIQDHVALWLKGFEEKVSLSIQKAKSDEQIFKIYQAELNSDFWAVLNAFNPRHYRIKTSWLEFLIRTVSHKHASTRLMNQVVMQLEKLQLNAEHKTEIEELKTRLKKGKISFEKSRVPWVRAIGMTLILLLVIAGIIGIWYIPAQPEETIAQENTSFMELSQAERTQIDSLISSVEQERLQKEKETTEGYLPEPEADLVLRNNDSQCEFWKYYSKWRSNKTGNFATQFSKSKVDKRKLPRTLSLAECNGDVEIGFINHSKLTALVIVFDEFMGETYSCFVAAGKQFKFKCRGENMHLVVVTGSNPASSLEAKNLPFNEVNEYFFQQLEDIYTITGTQKKMKVVLDDFSANGTILVDLNQGLSR